VDRSYHAAIQQTGILQAPEAQLVTGDAPPAGTIIAFDLPDPERLRQLCAAGEVVLMIPPGSEGYVARIASPRRPLQLSGAIDAARTLETSRRNAVVKTIEAGEWNRSLLTLAPLFERHDPAVVAAALFELWTSSAAGPAAPLPADIPATSKIYVSAGKKDGITASDLVGVMTKELGVARGKIGRIELRETYSLVETPALEAEKTAAALNGVTLRRKRVTARVDRGPTLQRPSVSDSRSRGGRGSPERQGRSKP
jgi:ATP-dependent RNA helicase DeaD